MEIDMFLDFSSPFDLVFEGRFLVSDQLLQTRPIIVA